MNTHKVKRYRNSDTKNRQQRTTTITGPDSLEVRASASGALDRGFAPRSRHTKGVKNGTSSSLTDAHIKH